MVWFVDLRELMNDFQCEPKWFASTKAILIVFYIKVFSKVIVCDTMYLIRWVVWKHIDPPVAHESHNFIDRRGIH